MIPSNELDTIGIAKLQAGEKGDGLHAEKTSIDVVTCKPKEEKRRARGESGEEEEGAELLSSKEMERDKIDLPRKR